MAAPKKNIKPVAKKATPAKKVPVKKAIKAYSNKSTIKVTSKVVPARSKKDIKPVPNVVELRNYDC